MDVISVESLSRLIESTKSVFSLAEIGVIKLKHNPIETKPTNNWLSKFFRGFRQKFGGQLWGREKIKAKN